MFPEVLRVSGNAVGTQRVTVKLNPESLGEVRVVLTSRRGGLEVTLAGGEDARRALTEGAPELRRLLESVGRTDSRILIRDLPAGAVPTPGTTATAVPTVRTDLTTDLSGGTFGGFGGTAGQSGGESPDREAPRQQTPGSTTATDGTLTATNPSRRTETVTRGHAGLDVTM